MGYKARLLAMTTALALSCATAHAATSVLFIGNSFTFGYGSALRYYRADTVRDLNGEAQGGVPALFRSFTQQAGLDYDVALETRGGIGLDWHLANRLDLITRQPWDIVVAHGYSTLDADRPGNPAKLVAGARQLAQALLARNRNAGVWLEATFPRADQSLEPKGAWYGKGIGAMARDVRAAYDQAAKASGGIKGVIPVGEAWIRAVDMGLADGNPLDGIDAGKLDLWTFDNYHASVAGYYLKGLVVFGALTKRDPRSLGAAECSGFELGLSQQQVKGLQQVAWEQLAADHLALPAPAADKVAGEPQHCATAR